MYFKFYSTDQNFFRKNKKNSTKITKISKMTEKVILSISPGGNKPKTKQFATEITNKTANAKGTRSKQILCELGHLRKDIREGICILNAGKSGKPVDPTIVTVWKEALEEERTLKSLSAGGNDAKIIVLEKKIVLSKF